MSEKSQKAMKEITLKANERLQEIKREINKGDYKGKIFEKEILSDAVLNYPVKRIEVLRESRKAGDDALREVFKSYKEQGGDYSYDDFLKNIVVPTVSSKKRPQKLKASAS